MKVAINTDHAGIDYKDVPLEQYDYYDSDLMLKSMARYDKRIGSLLMVFTELEHTLDRALSFIINQHSDDIGYLYTMDLSYSQKIKLYTRIGKNVLVVNEFSKEDLQKFLKFMEELKIAGYIRNLVAHAKWMSLDGDGFVRSKANVSDDAWLQFRYYKLTPKTLYNKERWIWRLDAKLDNFLGEHELL